MSRLLLRLACALATAALAAAGSLAAGRAQVWAQPLRVAEPRPRILAVLSKELQPYRLALQGFTAELPEAQLQVIRPEELDAAGAAQLVVAVGPEAALACRRLGRSPALFLMVLDPDKLALSPMAGVSLSVPAGLQLARIAAALPAVRRLGLLFDAQHNGGLAAQAAAAAEPLGLQLVPLSVRAAEEIPTALAEAKIDALWLVPDRTVVTRSILDFVLQRAVAARLPVVGFNSWFLGHGAVLSLIIDYAAVGRQAARRALELLRPGPSPIGVEAPRQVDAVANLEMARRLGVRVEPAAVLPWRGGEP